MKLTKRSNVALSPKIAPNYKLLAQKQVTLRLTAIAKSSWSLQQPTRLFYHTNRTCQCSAFFHELKLYCKAHCNSKTFEVLENGRSWYPLGLVVTYEGAGKQVPQSSRLWSTNWSILFYLFTSEHQSNVMIGTFHWGIFRIRTSGVLPSRREVFQSSKRTWMAMDGWS